MGDYSKLNLTEINEILEDFDLGKCIRFNPQGHGISNSNYQILTESQENHLLKVSNDKDLKQLKDEQEILLALKEAGFAYSLVPKLTKKNSAVFQTPKYHGVIFPFALGEVPQISTDVLKKIAKAIAKLHKVEINNKNIREHTEVGYNLEQIDQFVQSPKCPDDYKEAYQNVFSKDDLKKLKDFKWTRTIIHGDLYFDNTLFTNGELETILDFEQSGMGEDMLDLGISISGSCLLGSELHAPYIKDFIESYNEERELSNEQRNIIPLAIHLGLFSISLWRIKRFYYGSLDPLKKHSYRELLQRSINYSKL